MGERNSGQSLYCCTLINTIINLSAVIGEWLRVYVQYLCVYCTWMWLRFNNLDSINTVPHTNTTNTKRVLAPLTKCIVCWRFWHLCAGTRWNLSWVDVLMSGPICSALNSADVIAHCILYWYAGPYRHLTKKVNYELEKGSAYNVHFKPLPCVLLQLNAAFVPGLQKDTWAFLAATIHHQHYDSCLFRLLKRARTIPMTPTIDLTCLRHFTSSTRVRQRLRERTLLTHSPGWSGVCNGGPDIGETRLTRLSCHSESLKWSLRRRGGEERENQSRADSPNSSLLSTVVCKDPEVVLQTKDCITTTDYQSQYTLHKGTLILSIIGSFLSITIKSLFRANMQCYKGIYEIIQWLWKIWQGHTIL